jgi:short-subunit dehydrogenase
MCAILSNLFIFAIWKTFVGYWTSRYEFSTQFANGGHQVLAISRKTPQALLEHENISCLSVDLAIEQDVQAVQSLYSRPWKTVDAIIHNAGSLINKPLRS